MSLIQWWRNRSIQTGPESSAAQMQVAAEGGDAEAQFQLGLQLGADQPRSNLKQAARWYEKAAQQGHTLAQFNLATMLSRGQGVSRDDSAASVWIRRAADGGDAAAQFQLGRRYHRTSINRTTDNCSESRIEAYKWFRIAAYQGYIGSQAACDEMTMQMTRDDVADGNRRADQFVSQAWNVGKIIDPPKAYSPPG